ncbi:hypothetical protein D3C71_1415570 [compost metagenome]
MICPIRARLRNHVNSAISAIAVKNAMRRTASRANEPTDTFKNEYEGLILRTVDENSVVNTLIAINEKPKVTRSAATGDPRSTAFWMTKRW